VHNVRGRAEGGAEAEGVGRPCFYKTENLLQLSRSSSVGYPS
jgi:hypothetical protein